MKIRSIDRTTNDILKGGFYKIPRFQRPYSWERENVEDFWNDIFVNSGSDYFIGSMVVFQPEHADTASVVDGQQRLTTITMLLAAIRNAFASEGLKDSASGIQALIERPDIDNHNQYSLQTETSYPYFQQHIQSSTPPEVDPELGKEEEALQLTFGYFSDQIADTIAAIKGDKASDPKATSIKVYHPGNLSVGDIMQLLTWVSTRGGNADFSVGRELADALPAGLVAKLGIGGTGCLSCRDGSAPSPHFHNGALHLDFANGGKTVKLTLMHFFKDVLRGELQYGEVPIRR